MTDQHAIWSSLPPELVFEVLNTTHPSQRGSIALVNKEFAEMQRAITHPAATTIQTWFRRHRRPYTRQKYRIVIISEDEIYPFIRSYD